MEETESTTVDLLVTMRARVSLGEGVDLFKVDLTDLLAEVGGLVEGGIVEVAYDRPNDGNAFVTAEIIECSGQAVQRATRSGQRQDVQETR